MSNKLEVEPYISNSSYFFEQKNSRCYIVNEKTHREFLLQGKLADLWKVILTTKDYNKVKEYAKIHNIEYDPDEFINELKLVGIIGIENNFTIKQDGLGEGKIGEEENEHNLEKQNWLKANNFLCELILELSYRCNLACKHCYNDKDYPELEIDFDTAKNVIDEAVELGVNNVYISSGECTISKDFLKICEYIRKNRIPFTFVTNGQELYDNKELFDKIINLYPHRVKLSLYSMNPLVHDNITGVKGSQEKTVAVIRKLRENNILVTINYFQLCLNKDSINDVIKFKDEIGASISIDAMFINNVKNNNAFMQATDEQLYDLFGENGPCFNQVGRKNLWSISDDEAPVCKNIKQMLCVSPALDVYPCIALKYKLGNLKEKNLKDIFYINLDYFMNIFKIKNLENCKNCKDFEYCIYCPALALYENGFMKKSDICCNLTKIRMDIYNKTKRRKIL